MAKATTCKEAIARWEAARPGLKAEEAEKVELWGQCPPVEKMDSALNGLKACRHLALSTNCIDKIGALAGLERLEILSLARNQLKKMENLEGVAGSLRELWLSYNQIDRLAGIEKCSLLRVLTLSNNRVKDWAELERLAALPALEELLLVGNPLWCDFRDNNALAQYRVEVLKRIPKLKKLDGQPIEVEEREAAGLKPAAAAPAAVAAEAAPAT